MNAKLIIPGLFFVWLLLKPKALGAGDFDFDASGNVIVDASAEAAVMSLSYLGDTSLPRGMRNNNPGNLKDFGEPWQGSIGVTNDPPFEQFTGYVWGVRAMARLIRNKINGEFNTLTTLINNYAPPASAGGDNSDQTVSTYISTVANRTGIDPNQPLTAD